MSVSAGHDRGAAGCQPTATPALIIGHRGASAVAPENTMAAFRTAIALGADGVELDVQLSADCEPVVIHDKRVDRTSNGAGYVSQFTAAELTSLDAGWRFVRRLETHPRLRARVQRLAKRADGGAYSLSPQPIPRLASVLEHLAGSSLTRIYVEIKGSELTKGLLLRRSLGTIRRLRLERMVTLLSFDHSIMALAKQMDPSVRTAVTIPGLVKGLPTARSIVRAARVAHADEIAVHFSIASPRLVRALHESGLQVSAWTANRRIIMKRLVAFGVDAIMTNHVDRLRAIIYDSDRPQTGSRDFPSDKRV